MTAIGIIHLKRRINSKSGNPRYSIAIKNCNGTTPTDAGWVYEICDNWNGKEGVGDFEGGKCTRLHLI